MFLWNLISIVLVIIVLVEARSNDWQRPKFTSFATIAGLWFVGSITLFYLNQTA